MEIGTNSSKKALIDRKLLKLENKRKQVETAELTMKNVINKSKEETLNILFSNMRASGVDLQSDESIAEYFQRIYDNDPDLYELLVRAINSVSSGLNTESQFKSSLPNIKPNITPPPVTQPTEVSNVPN